MSSSLVISTKELSNNNLIDNASNFVVNFSPPIELGGLDYEVAVAKVNTWYTAVNLTSATLDWSSSATGTTTITIPTGNYTVDDINNLLKQSLEDNSETSIHATTGAITYPIRIVPNYNTNKVDVIIDDSKGANTTYALELSTSSNIVDFLGYAASDLSGNGTYTGSSIANVNAGVDEWQIRCDLHRNAYGNGNKSDVILSFVPRVPPSANIEVEPLHLKYFQVNKSTIDSLRIRLTDQSGTEIDLNGEHMVVTFSLRPIQNN